MANRTERVPYTDGLLLGQGFNTYLQDGRKSDAVTVTTGDESTDESTSLDISYSAQMITEYDQLIESLEISAGAGVSKMDVGGSIDAKFLDRDEFERSFLTYLVKVDVRRQPGPMAHYHLNWTSPANPHEIFGDRFISNFITGGALFARVSILSLDSSHHRDIEQAANVAFPVYGVDVKLTEEIKQSMHKIHQRSTVNIYFHYVGAPPQTIREEFDADLDNNSLIQLKATADKFLAAAKNHSWKRFALLERYPHVSNWDAQFKPLDYSDAEDRSWAVFNDYTECRAVQTMIRAIKENHYKNGWQQREQLDDAASNALEAYRKWVTSVSANPDHAKTKPSVEAPRDLRTKVLHAVKATRYIGQSIQLKNRARTYFLDKALHHNAKQHFVVEAFDFDDVAGTTSLLFGKKRGEDKYICLIGRDMTPGYEEISEMWVFEKPVHKVFEQGIKVFALAEMGVIELEPYGLNREITQELFSFYAKKM
ncbi:hypothetical protein CDD83_955 [Cordyceps sp. RAO-2017]|nr:hypothetical protein CDD83_955 [Cordyceps sp. RAO-2017]